MVGGLLLHPSRIGNEFGKWPILGDDCERRNMERFLGIIRKADFESRQSTLNICGCLVPTGLVVECFWLTTKTKKEIRGLDGPHALQQVTQRGPLMGMGFPATELQPAGSPQLSVNGPWMLQNLSQRSRRNAAADNRAGGRSQIL